MSAQPGWYPDTTMPGTQRFWDGETWTEHRAPLQTTTPATSEHVQTSVMILGLVTGIIAPVIGFVIGLTQLGKKDGIWIVGVSLIGFLLWWAVLANA